MRLPHIYNSGRHRSARVSNLRRYPEVGKERIRSKRIYPAPPPWPHLFSRIRHRDFGADLMDRPPKSAVDQAAFQRLLVPSSIRAQSRRRIGKSLLDRREGIEQQIAFRFFSAYTAALCSAGRRACRSRWERPCDAADSNAWFWYSFD